jgi:hypothetical protein
MILTALFDTNIYGKIAEEKETGLELAKKIKQDPGFVIHNFRLIRNELRKAPNILPIYDDLVAQRVIDETKQIKDLAKEYFKEYKSNGGVQGQKKILNDFKIVACATLLNSDVIASDDKRTMQHPIAVKSYRNVNIHIGRTPTFFTYADLKRKYG